MKENPILIQVAMEIECQKLLEKLNDLEELEINNYKFYKAKLLNYPIIISLSKVGLIHASSSLTIAIKEFNPKMIINTGIAGATDPKMHIGDIVIGKKCLNINSYRTAKLKKDEGSDPTKWELLTFLSGEKDRIIYEYSDEWLLELTQKVIAADFKIYYGTIGSGDVWNNEYDRIIYLNKNYQILCEDMESIATYTISNQQKIPVISIKMISDNSLTGEEYNREVGKDLQDYMYNYLKEIIASL